MRNQYQIQQFNPLGTRSTLFTAFESLEAVKKNNVVGTVQLVVPTDQLIGVGFEVLENISYTIDWTNYKNAIYVGGAGNGEDRLIVTVKDEQQIGLSLWGRAEVFEASRDSTDSDALAEVGRNFLGSKREIVTFAGDLSSQPGSEYLVNYFFGDVLSFSQPNVNAVFNTPYIIQSLNNRGVGIVNNTIYFLKKIIIDNNRLTATLVLNDALSLLDQRIVAYPLGTANTTKELPADNLIKEICRENLLVDGREVANMRIDNDKSLAPIVKVDDIAWRSVLSVCQEIAEASFEKGVPLYFDVVADINLGMVLKTFVGQRGQDRAGVVGIGSPYRAMINSVHLIVADGREDYQVELLQLNGEELSAKIDNIVVTSNEATISSRAGRSSDEPDPFEFYLIDDDGELIIDDDGEFIIDDDG